MSISTVSMFLQRKYFDDRDAVRFLYHFAPATPDLFGLILCLDVSAYTHIHSRKYTQAVLSGVFLRNRKIDLAIFRSFNDAERSSCFYVVIGQAILKMLRVAYR